MNRTVTRFVVGWFFVGLCSFNALPADRQEPGGSLRLQFDQSKWIWFTQDEKLDLSSLAEGTVYFRKVFDLPEKAPVKSAEAVISVDNIYTLRINGKLISENNLEPDEWSSPGRFNITSNLIAGRNTIAVEAQNTAQGPAGMVFAMEVLLDNGSSISVNSDAGWKASDTADVNWHQPVFDDTPWRAARILGEFGMAPWGRLNIPAYPAKDKVSSFNIAERADKKMPEAIVFIAEDCSLTLGKGHASLGINIFNVRNTRAFPEYDLPLPVKIGRKLYSYSFAKTGGTPKLLVDAGTGAIGSPAVSYDGRSVLVAMAAAGDAFYHIYRIPAAGGKPQQLTTGPFHDIDPAEYPDGRIVFTSTRIGTFDEYHSAPSRALFSMAADGSDIKVVTPTFNYDNEPRVMSDGRLLFVRTDNFFDRAKVETLLHATRPDGTGGQIAFGLDNGPEYGGRLRAFNCGSPAPLPDGRVAFVTGSDIVVGRPGSASRDWKHIRVPAADISSLPDGMLLCSLASRKGWIGVLDPDAVGNTAVTYLEMPGTSVHSPVYLGPRKKPQALVETVDPRKINDPSATGILVCQNARITRNTSAGWPHIRAVRILKGQGITTRSSHSYLVHIGSEVTELGTIPLAPDGSFSVEVPADTPVAFQMVDAEGRSELNEMSWISVRPGEKRSCVGCHEARQVSPNHVAAQSMHTAPVKLFDSGVLHRFRGNNAAVTGLMETHFDRFREVAGLNRHSASVPELICQLSNEDDATVISAAQRLALARDPSAASALAGCLEHGKRREVRLASAMALAVCGTRESAKPLLAALDDSDHLVAQAAVVALENLTSHSEPSYNPYGKARKSELWRDWFRSNSWENIEKDLTSKLADKDRDVVRRAAVALGHTGESEAARIALRERLSVLSTNKAYVEWRQKNQGDNAHFNSLHPVNPRTVQAVARSIGYLKDKKAVPLLSDLLRQHSDPDSGNLFLAEAVAEALGRIGTKEAEADLVAAFAALKDFHKYTSWYGDHSALMACHSSPVHYFIAEGLDSMCSTQAAVIVTNLIRSVPIDFDRALFIESDDYEAVIGRVIARNDPDCAVPETCLSILGDPQAKPVEAIVNAVSKTPRCWGGNATPEIRAAQILTMVCHDRRYEHRIRAVIDRYKEKPVTIKRVYDHDEVPEVQHLPAKNWVCFYMGRILGNLADERSVAYLAELLSKSPTEAANGRPDPTGNGVLFLHNELTPCWRASAAWALGRIGDRKAVPVLLDLVRNMENAVDVRHAAAAALCEISDPSSVDAIHKLAEDYPEISVRMALLRATKVK